MQAGSGSSLKSCLRAWKEGGPSWCPPGEPCQSLAWAGLHPQLSLVGWRALRGSLFAGGRGRGGRRVAADPPAPQRARRPLHGGARPQPLHLLQVWGAEARGCPHGGGLGPGGLPSPLRPPSLPHPRLSFRMRQVNIVGTSPPSQPSRKIQTLQAPPDMAPANVTLRTASETSLWLRWVVRLPRARRGWWGRDVALRLIALQKRASTGSLPAPFSVPAISLSQTNKRSAQQEVRKHFIERCHVPSILPFFFHIILQVTAIPSYS